MDVERRLLGRRRECGRLPLALGQETLVVPVIGPVAGAVIGSPAGGEHRLRALQAWVALLGGAVGALTLSLRTTAPETLAVQRPDSPD